MSDFREYENGVADILSFVVGEAATVERDVHLLGRRSAASRQIDILVRGRIFGLDNASLAVDCKCWKAKVDVADVGTFLDLLEDVGADLGLLMTTKGYSAAAKERARQARGVRAEVVTLDELRQWSPRGTVHASYRVQIEKEQAVARRLRSVGFRVRSDATLEHSASEVVLEVFRHYGESSGDEQRRLMEDAACVLAEDGLPVIVAAHGVSIGGGTPAHRWLEVVGTEGQRLGLKVLADSDAEVQRQLDELALNLRLPRDVLDVDRPDDWPVRGLFGLPR